MKLRIEPDKISYRLDLFELDSLLEDGEISTATALPQGEISYRILCLETGKAPAFTVVDQTFTLCLARDVLLAHKADLPSLNGVITTFPTQTGHRLDVALEINLKKRRKHQLERAGETGS
ncbi:DUF7009 family protein [Paremcibacter congregatus]|uniref:Uncharacterized protein n=1 Tax=Paremcibacter congregatus TaxID=2043170 RepID=A0A2G4YQC9_9PROT|nr:hypothetical protein [Paremcibacter congregatus]PHZ84534.1 hypothetical protein CRD36_12070 [Paremcibacter congregatus]QDE28754.1 hypothetical protein FIV45_16480 [Paremcibacter congregatus]